LYFEYQEIVIISKRGQPMTKIPKCFYIILVVTFLIVISTSCTSQAKPYVVIYDDTNQTNQKVTLRFVSSWGGVDAKADTLQQILDSFMKENPNIKVINESLYGEDFLPKIKTDFVSGNDPDVFGIWPGSDIEALIKANKVADLTEVLKEDKLWKDSFKKDMWSYTTYNNRIYGLPLEIIYEGLFVNRGLFELYNAKIPTTYDELKQAIKIFKENDVIPIAYNSTAEGSYLYQNMAAILGGADEIQKPIKDGKISKSYLTAMNYMKELYNIGAFPQDCFTISSQDRDALFLNKKAAMIVQGSWFMGRISEEDNQNGMVDIVPFPYISGGKAEKKSMIYGLGNGVFYMSQMASSDPAKREASIKLLKALTSKKSAALFAEQTGMYSNVDLTGYNIHYGKLVKSGEELLGDSKNLIGPPDSFIDRNIWDNIITNFPYVLREKYSPEDVWGQAVSEWTYSNSN